MINLINFIWIKTFINNKFSSWINVYNNKTHTIISYQGFLILLFFIFLRFFTIKLSLISKRNYQKLPVGDYLYSRRTEKLTRAEQSLHNLQEAQLKASQAKFNPTSQRIVAAKQLSFLREIFSLLDLPYFPSSKSSKVHRDLFDQESLSFPIMDSSFSWIF